MRSWMGAGALILLALALVALGPRVMSARQERCGQAGERPSDSDVFPQPQRREDVAPPLLRAYDQATAVFPGRVLNVSQAHLTRTEQQNWRGISRLSVAVNGSQVAQAEVPQLYGRSLPEYGRALLGGREGFGAVSLKVLHDSRWVYGAGVYNAIGESPRVFVQRNWRCK